MRLHSTGVRRLQTEALLARAQTRPDGIERKELVIAARDAGEALLLRASVRSVLMELVACYGAPLISGELIVWPSNRRLVDRTGLSERTIRLALADLIRNGLLAPKDSANGKRFAIKRDAAILDAYGFDLAPLAARKEEFRSIIAARQERRREIGRQYDRATIARKAIEEALRSMEVHYPDIARGYLSARFADLLERLPRRSSYRSIEPVVAELEKLREEAERLFLKASEIKDSGRAGYGRRHKETDNERPIGNCKESSEERRPVRSTERTDASLSHQTLLDACPSIQEFTPCPTPTDLINAAATLRSAIGASRESFSEAQDRIGAYMAAALVAYVLQIHWLDAQRANAIKNPGGLFRSLARKIETGEFNLEIELARLRRKMKFQ